MSYDQLDNSSTANMFKSSKLNPVLHFIGRLEFNLNQVFTISNLAFALIGSPTVSTAVLEIKDRGPKRL